jgi:hypothetical protein
MPLFFPAFKTFKFYHLPHHWHVTINPDEHNVKKAKDSEDKGLIYDVDLPTEFEAWLFSSNPIMRAMFLFLQTVLYSVRPMIICPKPLFFEDFIGIIT